MPGIDVLALTAPLFPRATVRLPGGTLEINAPGATARSVAIRSAAVDGRPLARTWLPFARLRHGGQLDVVVGHRGGSWGTAASARPPSFSPAATCAG